MERRLEAGAHHSSERAQSWRAAAREPVLVDVLRNPNAEERLAWVQRQHRHYVPYRSGSRRQLMARWVAFYLAGRYAVTHCAPVRSIEVLPRAAIDSPWAATRPATEPQVVYHLGELEELPRPIRNPPRDSRALPFVRHRWTSRLSLLRAGTLAELLLETEPEWRLYEDLRAAGLDVRIHAGRRIRPAGPEEQESRAWLITPAGSARFAEAAGFEVDLGGTRRFVPDIGQVLRLLRPG